MGVIVVARQNLEVTQFTPDQDAVVAVLHETMTTGESYIGPLSVGAYAGQDEIWLEREGKRISFQVASLPALIKHLRRAVEAAHPKEPVHD